MITYDADRLIDDIYAGFEQESMEISYTANVKMVGKEKMILGPDLSWPRRFESR